MLAPGALVLAKSGMDALNGRLCRGVDDQMKEKDGDEGKRKAARKRTRNVRALRRSFRSGKALSQRTGKSRIGSRSQNSQLQYFV